MRFENVMIRQNVSAKIGLGMGTIRTKEEEKTLGVAGGELRGSASGARLSGMGRLSAYTVFCTRRTLCNERLPK